MIKRELIILVSLCLLCLPRADAQRNYLQVFAIGVPFQSGAGIGNIGFEHLNKERNGSWQFAFNAAGGSLGNDAGDPHRIWFTIDKIIQLNKKMAFTNAPFVSFFIEAGKRRVSGERLYGEVGDYLQSTVSFEINPGVGIGRNFRLGKKIHLQLLAGPKAIIAFAKDEVLETASNEVFFTRHTELSAGYRVLINFCFPIGK